MVKSCSKFYKLRYSRKYGWILRGRKYETLDRFFIYSYVGHHTYGVENVIVKHKNSSSTLITSLLTNDCIDDKGPTSKKMERTIFRELQSKVSYYKCWNAGVLAKNMNRSTPEHEYAYYLGFTHMV